MPAKRSASTASRSGVTKSKSTTRSTEPLPLWQPPSSEPWQPHAYQKKAIRFLLEHACAALFLDPGLGKTSVTLAALKLLKQKGLIHKALVIAPLRVCYSVWPKEKEKWKDFSGLKIELLHGPDKDAALAREADVCLINPEGLDWLIKPTKTRSAKGRVSVKVDAKAFKKLGFDVLVIDELTAFKNTASVRFKSLKEVHKTFGRRWGLTGSPASNGLLDLFGQCYILDEGRSLGPYITHYRNKYFTSPSAFTWVPKGPETEHEIYERLAPLALRMAAEDYLELPELIENTIKLEMPEEARAVYDQLEDKLITGVLDRRIVAANSAVASMKCRQVANGGLYLDPEVTELGLKIKGPREWVNLHYTKVDVLAELIEELQGEPLLVAYDFGHDLDRLQERLGREVPYVGGGVSPKRSAELERLWNAGKLPVLLGQPVTLARGLNLQESGRHVAWHSMTWDFEVYDQFIRRVWRQGNKSSRVFVHHLLMKDTVDEVMRYALRSKDRGQQALFKGLYELARRRKNR